MVNKIGRLIVFVAVLAAAVMFAINNQETVAFHYPWPLEQSMRTSMAVLCLVCFLTGVLFSIFFLGSAYIKNWNSLRKTNKEVHNLKTELAQHKQTQSQQALESTLKPATSSASLVD